MSDQPKSATEAWILKQPVAGFIETARKEVHCVHIVYERGRRGDVESFRQTDEIVNARYETDCENRAIVGQFHKERPEMTPHGKTQMCRKCETLLAEREKLRKQKGA